MSTVRVYKSTDPGAPAHPNSTRGSMAALLRACLVEGWTSGGFTATPAGWEEPYPETNNYACFRATQGVAKKFYQVNDNQSDADVTRMTSYDSMTDAATGVGERGSDYFGKWAGSSVGATSWWVIADEKTCYVVLQSQYGHVPHGFGEFYSTIDADPYKGFLAGHSNSTYMTTSSNAAMMCGKKDYGASLYRIESGELHSSSFRSYGAVLPASYNLSTCLNGTEHTYPAMTGVSYPVFPGHRFSSMRYHGKLRGVYYPAVYKPKTHASEFVFNNKTMLAINMGSGNSSTDYQGQIWFDITGTWEEST